jgi:hypothetical protein
MSLPYFAENGWNAEIVMVDEKYADIGKDPLLLQSVPANIKIHKVKALDKKWTSKLGLGSIALRALPFYRRKVNELLKSGKYDLIYFSTTQFQVCILGNYWKKRFKIPYVIDMQDPWHSDYYKNKPKDQQPKKYWFSYWMHKNLEPIAMKNVDGLISVSEKYIINLKNRYSEISGVPASVITFGAFEPDLQIANNNKEHFSSLIDAGSKNIVYVGRGGNDMHKALAVLFKAIKDGIDIDKKIFGQLRFYFIGTSYAPAGKGNPSIMPLAMQYGIEDYVVEITDRISYFHSIITLQQADALFIPGSDDPGYTASKIYPYLLVKKPLLAVFNEASSAINILKEYGSTTVYSYQGADQNNITAFLKNVAMGSLTTATYQPDAIKKYSTANMAQKQCALFDEILQAKIKEIQ